MTVSTTQIAAQLEAVLHREPDVRAVAIRAPAAQDWPDAIPRKGRRFAVRWCESLLALREALVEDELDGTPESGVLLLTPFGTHQLPDDVAARIAKARVYQPEGWSTVRELFVAHELDARLGRFAWMPQLLIDASVGGPYNPVAGGFLDLETAWREVLSRSLGIANARPDALALLLWTQQPESLDLLNALPAAARADLLQWLADSAGTVGRWTVACIDAGRMPDALPLGMVCDVLFAAGGEGESALGQAAVRLERFVGGQHVGITDGRAWAEAARRLVERDGVDALHGALDRADALLQELRAADCARLSDLLPRGFEQRMQDFASTLAAHVAAPAESLAGHVEEAASLVLQHVLARTQQIRVERVQMARRLSRWLLRTLPTSANAEDLVAWQIDEGAFVDWARFRLMGGDELPDVSDAYSQLRAAMVTRQSAIGHRFAASLKERLRQGIVASRRAVPVESILSEVLAPLAVQHPVLLLVIDGLSLSIFRELFERPERHGWGELVRESIQKPVAGLAALPTVTQISRASLLSGRVTSGAAPQEKAAFSSHAALLAPSRALVPPRLFHKGELADGGSLAQEVRQALSNPQQRVVGVVYNAVDDHLSGPEQLQQRWTLEDLRLILPLLREARDARRVVVITADHGHVLEDGSRAVTGGADSDRWRPGAQSANEFEVALAGGRVLSPDGSNTVVCLWSESARYCGRKNGYHGGASLQEVTVPLNVFVPLGLVVDGWQQASPPQPDWWDLPLLVQQLQEPRAPAKRTPARRVPKVVEGQGGLFADNELPLPVAPSTVAQDWIGALIASATYVSQRQLAARVALPDAQMRALLQALDERGGKLSRAALAQRLNVPELRLGGLLSAARRVLNVDQSPVVQVEELTGTIELNIALLKRQFRLAGDGA